MPTSKENLVSMLKDLGLRSSDDVFVHSSLKSLGYVINGPHDVIDSLIEVIKIDKGIIEFLIPLTILLTALYNLTKSGQNQNNKSKVWIAGVFGLIHGLGFSNYYDMLVMGDSNYWQALLPFNLGIELAQLLLVAITLLVMGIYSFMLNRKIRDWNLFVSGAGFGLALIMCLENWPF